MIQYPNIKRYMKENNMSLRNLAKQCGMSASSMSRILNGEVDMKKSSIDKILKATGMGYEECFEEVSD